MTEFSKLSIQLGEYFGTLHAVLEVTTRRCIFKGFLTWQSVLDNMETFRLPTQYCISVNGDVLHLKGLYGNECSTTQVTSFFAKFSDIYEDTYQERKKIFTYYYNIVLVELIKKTYVLKKISKMLGYPSFEKNLLFMIYEYSNSSKTES